MFACLCKALLNEQGRHIFKMEKLRVVIKFFCKKGMPHMEIHEDFMENLGKESTYSTVKMGSNVEEGEWER